MPAIMISMRNRLDQKKAFAMPSFWWPMVGLNSKTIFTNSTLKVMKNNSQRKIFRYFFTDPIHPSPLGFVLSKLNRRAHREILYCIKAQAILVIPLCVLKYYSLFSSFSLYSGNFISFLLLLSKSAKKLSINILLCYKKIANP